MPDQFSPVERSAIMRAVKARDTRAEQTVCRAVRTLGYRFRRNVGNLPGQPDLVFRHLKKVVFVHGCFWHRHACSEGISTPATRIRYWCEKFARNVRRDRSVVRKLRRLGWGVMIIWECQTKPARLATLRSRLRRFLSATADTRTQGAEAAK
jgi:DNA mismatch endonuclease (patch repair protein)